MSPEQSSDSTRRDLRLRRGDTARAFYATARDEAITRVRQRDQGLVFFIAFAAALAGIALSQHNLYPILLVVPFVGLGATHIVAQHHLVIGALASYCAIEIDEALDEAGQNVMQWELSNALGICRMDARELRLGAHWILLVLPSLASLVITALSILLPTVTEPTTVDQPTNAVASALTPTAFSNPILALLWVAGLAFMYLSWSIVVKTHRAKSKYDATIHNHQKHKNIPNTK